MGAEAGRQTRPGGQHRVGRAVHAERCPTGRPRRRRHRPGSATSTRCWVRASSAAGGDRPRPGRRRRSRPGARAPPARPRIRRRSVAEVTAAVPRRRPNQRAWSLTLHSHSRLARKLSGSGKTSASSTASTENTGSRAATSAGRLGGDAPGRRRGRPVPASVDAAPSPVEHRRRPRCRWASVTRCTWTTRSEVGHPPVDRDRQLADRAELGELVGVLGVVVGQQSVGVERAEHPLPHQRAQLGRRLPAVQADGRDQGDVVDPGRRCAGQHGLDDRRPQIGRRHRRAPARCCRRR